MCLVSLRTARNPGSWRGASWARGEVAIFHSYDRTRAGCDLREAIVSRMNPDLTSTPHLGEWWNLLSAKMRTQHETHAKGGEQESGDWWFHKITWQRRLSMKAARECGRWQVTSVKAVRWELKPNHSWVCRYQDNELERRLVVTSGVWTLGQCEEGSWVPQVVSRDLYCGYSHGGW